MFHIQALHISDYRSGIIERIHPVVAKILDKPMECFFDVEEIIYNSVDTMRNVDETVNFPVEFLNSLIPSGISYYSIILKRGISIMHLRSLKLLNFVEVLGNELKNFLKIQCKPLV